jgi:hypothetical protein
MKLYFASANMKRNKWSRQFLKLDTMALVLKNTLCYEAQARAFSEACSGIGSDGEPLREVVSVKARGQNGGASFGEQFALPVDDDNKNYSPGTS